MLTSPPLYRHAIDDTPCYTNSTVSNKITKTSLSNCNPNDLHLSRHRDRDRDRCIHIKHNKNDNIGTGSITTLCWNYYGMLCPDIKSYVSRDYISL